jgi:surface protein|nr:BspA family leucine-rich repeat surface protein [uncultured Acetatifactor sp.]
MRKKYWAGAIAAALLLTSISPTSYALEAIETLPVDIESQGVEDTIQNIDGVQKANQAETAEPFGIIDEDVVLGDDVTEEDRMKKKEISEDEASVMTRAEDDIANGKDGNIEWAVSADGKLTIMGTGDFTEPINYYSNNLWRQYRDSITSAEVNLSGMTNATNLFQGCENLCTVDLSQFDTSSITNMEGMFSGCSNLTELDLSSFNTVNVTDMRHLFAGCSSLHDIGLRNFSTSNVTDMGGMFSGCSSLATLDVSSLDTSNVVYMETMFSSCTNLRDLNLTNFNTSSAVYMNSMFSDSSSLVSLDLSGFDTGNVEKMSYMFSGCTGLKKLDLRGFNTEKVIDMSAMFSACRSLTELDLANFNTSIVVNMNEMFGYCDHLASLNVSSFDTGSVTNMHRMFADCLNLKILDVSNFETGNVTNMQEMFMLCAALENLDLSNFDTRNVSTMNEMFKDCRNLADLKIDSFDTGNVVTMNGMFAGCWKLADLGVGSFNTANVSNMAEIFSGCRSLVDLDLSNFDISQAVNNTWGMFVGCDALKILHAPQTIGETTVELLDFFQTPDGRRTNQLSSAFANTTLTRTGTDDSSLTGYVNGTNDQVSWTYVPETKTIVVTGKGIREVNQPSGYIESSFPIETEYVIFEGCEIEGSLAWLFYGLNELKAVDFTKLTMKNVTSFQDMFGGCRSLISLNLDNFDSSQVTDMSLMFYDCSSLATLDLSNLDTGSVRNMDQMFGGCQTLGELDLSSFDTRNVTTMEHMLIGCDSLVVLHTPKVMGEAVTRLPAYYVDASGKQTVDLTAAFADTVLTKTENENVGFVDGTSNDILWVYDPETKTTVITGKGYRSVMYIYQPSCFPKETEYIRFEDCEIKESYGSLFADLNNLKAIDFTNLKVTNPTDYSSMFFGCSSLTELDLNSFGTNSTAYVSMDKMFEGCSNLLELNISSLNMAYVETADSMFSGCDSLQKLATPERRWDIAVALPGLYKDSAGNQTRDLTADFTGTILTKVEERIVSSDYNEILDALKSEEIKEIQYVLEEVQTVSRTEQQEIFTELQDSGKELSFVFQDASGEEIYRWTFQGNEITNPAREVDFQIIVDANDPEVLAVAPSGQQVDLRFLHEGGFPGSIEVGVNVGNYFEAGTLCLYYYNPDKKVLEVVDGNVRFDGKFAFFNLSHCSRYILAKVNDGLGVSGRVTSFGDQEKNVQLQLLDGEGKVVAETTVKGLSAEYGFMDVMAGNYTLQISKAGHVTREYSLAVQAESVKLDAEICLIGDVDSNGRVNAKDKRIIYNHIAGTSLTGYEFMVGDVDGNGKINARDKRLIYNHIAGISLLWQ